MKENKTPSNLIQFFFITRYEILKLKERKRLLLGVIISIFLALFTCIIVPLTLSYVLRINFYYGLTNINGFHYSNLSFLAVILIFFPVLFSSDSLSYEYEKNTGLSLFIQPVRKDILALGKMFGSYLLIILMIMIYYIIITIFSLIIYPSFESIICIYPLFLSFILSLAISFTYLSITFLVNSFFNKTIFTVIIILVGIFVISPMLTPLNDLYWFHYLNIPYTSIILTLDYFKPIYGYLAAGYPNTILVLIYLMGYVIISIFLTCIWENRKNI